MTENSMPVETVTTSAICDHTCWPQQFPQMLFRWLHESLTLLILCVSVCVCQLLPTLWVGHRTAAGEGQEDSAEDQTLQDETGTEGTLLCRCKDVRLVCVWGRTVLPVSTQIFGFYFFIFFWGGGLFVEDISISGCGCLHNLVCLLGCNCTFSTHLRAHIWVSLLTHLIQYNVYLSFQMVSGHFGLFPLFNLFHFLLCFPSVSLRWKRSHLTLTM